MGAHVNAANKKFHVQLTQRKCFTHTTTHTQIL